MVFSSPSGLPSGVARDSRPEALGEPGDPGMQVCRKEVGQHPGQLHCEEACECGRAHHGLHPGQLLAWQIPEARTREGVLVARQECLVALSAFAGYLLIQRNLPGKRLMIGFILATMAIPGELIMIPLFIVNQNLGLLNTLAALVCSSLVSGFSILLIRNYFQSVSYHL